MSVSGHLVGVTEDRYGATLVADLTIGDTVLQLGNTVDFDEESGGYILINGTKLAYLPFDDLDEDDSDDDGPTTLTLAAPSPIAADDGDRVWAFDPTTGEDDPVTEVVAMVTIDDRDPGDSLPARVRAGLVEQLDSDFETYLGKAVELEVTDQGELVLVDILGSKRTGGEKFYEDETVALGAGTETLLLTYRPKPHSEHLYWAGKYERGAEWSRDMWTVTIPNETLLIKAGDKLVMEYAYEDPATRPIVPADLELIGFASFGTDNTPFTSIPIPGATEAGDLLVVGCMCYAPNQPVVSTDARVITQNSQVNTSGIGGVFPNGAYYTALAIADATLDDLDIAQAGIADSVVICAAFRYAGELSATWTGIRDAVADGNIYDLAAPDGTTKAIAVLIGQRGVVSGGFSDDSTLTYDTVDGQSDGHLGLAQALIAWSETGGAGEWGGLSSPSAWAGMMIGVSDG